MALSCDSIEFNNEEKEMVVINHPRLAMFIKSDEAKLFASCAWIAVRDAIHTACEEARLLLEIISAILAHTLRGWTVRSLQKIFTPSTNLSVTTPEPSISTGS